MALAPSTVERIVWVALPVALFFALRVFRLMSDGFAWSAAAHAVVAVLFVGGLVATNGRVLSGRRGAIYFAFAVPGLIAWLVGPNVVVQVVGFCIAMLAQLAAIVTARKSGVEGPRLRDDSPVELGINRRAG